MGLDWNPLGIPRKGKESAFYGFLGQEGSADRWMQPSGLKHGKLIFRRSVSSEDFFAAQVTPYETLQAPQVGSSSEADDWMLSQYENAAKKPPSPEEWLSSFNGYYVLQLVEENDGLPVYSNWGVGNHWERWSFRAQFLKDCEHVLGEDLLNEAWLHHMAPQLANYGDRLLECATEYAGTTGVSHVLHLRDIPDMGEDHLIRPEHIAHVISSAARWAKFWSSRGHGMEADF